MVHEEGTSSGLYRHHTIESSEGTLELPQEVALQTVYLGTGQDVYKKIREKSIIFPT